MAKCITIADIAQKLNLSRNTVSKALNGKHVPDKTKREVLQAAAELGYKSFPSLDNAYINLSGKNILLISSNMLMNIPFHVHVMRGMENELAKLNMGLLRYTISAISPMENLKEYIEKFEVDGILCMEFFKKNLIEQVLSLGLPTVFLDFSCERIESPYPYDVVMMENLSSVKEYCIDLAESGCRSFGFVGDIKNCLSFYERFLGMQCALQEKNIVYNPKNNVLADNALPYNNIAKLAKLIKHCELPDCFVCANDFLALMLLDALNTLEIHVPERIKVLGYENSAESKISKPTLSTINVNKTNLGKELKTFNRRIGSQSIMVIINVYKILQLTLGYIRFKSNLRTNSFGTLPC